MGGAGIFRKLLQEQKFLAPHTSLDTWTLLETSVNTLHLSYLTATTHPVMEPPTDLTHPTCPIWQAPSKAAPAPERGDNDCTLVYLQSQQPNLTSGSSANTVPCQ